MTPTHRRPVLGGLSRVWAAAAALVMALVGAGGAAVAAPVGHVAAAASTDAFTRDPDCLVDLPPLTSGRVECGWLEVPESRAEGADPEKTIRLAVAIISSRTTFPQPDPIVVLGWRAGSGDTDSLAHVLLDMPEIADERDVIIVAQRGDVGSKPALTCPQISAAETLAAGLTGAPPVAATTACRDGWRRDGADLAAYTSVATAADLADLRTALEYSTWNLYATADATRAAFSMMRDRPDGLRAVVLDGAVPPQVHRSEAAPAALLEAFSALEEACRTDSTCQAAKLRPTFQKALTRAAREPFAASLDGTPVTIDDAALAGVISDAIADPVLVRIVPAVLAQLAEGNASALEPLLREDVRQRPPAGLSLSATCSEDVPFVDDALVAEALAADPITRHLDDAAGLRDACAAWLEPVATADTPDPAPVTPPSGTGVAVTSDVATLLLAGGLDATSPGSWAQTAAASLPNAQLAVFPTTGRAPSWERRCAIGLVTDFFADPATLLDTACAARAIAPRFVDASGLRPTTALYRYTSDVVDHREPIPLTISVVLVLSVLATLLYAVIYGLRWAATRRGEAPGGVVLAAGTTSGLQLAYLVGLFLIVRASDPVALMVGIPGWIWPLLLLPFAAATTTLLLIGLLVRAWITADGEVGHRVALSLAAVAAIGVTVFLVVRGLMFL